MSEGAILSTLADSLKLDYKGPIVNRLNNTNAYFKQLEKTADSVEVAGSGLKAVFPIVTGDNQGIKSGAENITLPSPGQVTSLQLESPLKFTYGSIRFTGPTLKASAKNATRFAEVVQQEIDSITKGMRNEIGVQLISPAAGWLCQTNGAGTGATATVTVDNPGTRWLRNNMAIETRTYSVAAGVGTISAAVADQDISEGLTDSTAHRINQIGSTHLTFTLKDYNGSAITTEQWSDNRYMFRKGNAVAGTDTVSMLGLFDIMDDYTLQSTSSWFALQNCLITIQGKSRSTYSTALNAMIAQNGGTLRPVTEDVIQEGFDLVEEETGDNEHRGQMMVMDIAMRRRLMKMLRADRTFSSDYLRLEGGYTVFAYHVGNTKVPIIADRYCMANCILVPNINYIKIYNAGDFDWMDKAGSMFEKASDANGRYDAYIADMYYYAEQGCHSFRDQLAIRDLAA